jgi:hypothetical protein
MHDVFNPPVRAPNCKCRSAVISLNKHEAHMCSVRDNVINVLTKYIQNTSVADYNEMIRVSTWIDQLLLDNQLAKGYYSVLRPPEHVIHDVEDLNPSVRFSLDHVCAWMIAYQDTFNPVQRPSTLSELLQRMKTIIVDRMNVVQSQTFKNAREQLKLFKLAKNKNKCE